METETSHGTRDQENTSELLKSIAETANRIRKNLSQVIVGQDKVVNELLLSLVTGGHVLLEGVPGLAKTTLAMVLAGAAGLKHNRIQFTPDLMPGDILGGEILEENRETGEKNFRYQKGPIFTQVLLADEINRTPPKTQAALLQAMQEKRVSFGGHNHELPFPFIVYATQNPIENEGTYPLPEAQLDRFMMKIEVGYPDEKEERRISVLNPRKLPALSLEVAETEIPWASWYELLDKMPLADTLIDTAVAIARQSRPESGDEFISSHVRWGAGPRASQYLLLACRGMAALEGMATPNLEHLRQVAPSILRHRIIPSFSADSKRVTADHIIEYLLKKNL